MEATIWPSGRAKASLPACALVFWILFSGAVWPADTRDAQVWYDTLGFPDAKELPFVRVATGSWIRSNNQPPENRFVEGFLVRDEPEAFTVFICSVSDFKDWFETAEPYVPLTSVRFVCQTEGPAYTQVRYDIQDFRKVASEVLDRVRAQATNPEGGLRWGRPVAHRARIFAFARACLQKGLADPASALLELAANIPDEQTGKVDPRMLRDALQRQIGDAVLTQAEEAFGNPSLTWADLLKTYEQFDTRFPASPKIAYAQEAAELLRKMIAEDAEHQPKPLGQMLPAERVAENIYQLRNLDSAMWVINSRYPLDAYTREGAEVITPVHRLVDLGEVAVPQLIEAMEDRRFTRLMVDSFNAIAPPRVMRVGDVAQRILEHESGRDFYPRRTDAGALVDGTTRQQAEAWWAEVQSKGEKQVLMKAAAAGDHDGCVAARKLVEKYPDVALAAIEAGLRASTQEGYRGEFVEVAGGLPGAAPLAFLKSQLAPGNGLHSQVHAAEALFARGQPDAVPAMIEAWRKVQSRLPGNEADVYSEVVGLITFLAKSGSAQAIDALGRDGRNVPVDVRLAVVRMFLPWQKNAGAGSNGPSVHVDADINELPGGAAGSAIERLLVSALEDTERRIGMQGNFEETIYQDPRICDLAALVLSRRWPETYRFHWAADPVECDAQIVVLREQWRSRKRE